jgi:hypothetical protein
MTNLGMVGFKSLWGAYLQAHSDNGEMHASNMDRNEEETWFLVEVDKPNHLYAIYNWSNGNFMSKGTNGCAPAVSTVLGVRETWRVYSGAQYGVLNAICFQSTADNTFLGTNSPGNDSPCGGGVAAQGDLGPVAQENWVGWWVPVAATAPSPGKDFWNTVGNAVAGIVNQISPADVVSFLAILAPSAAAFPAAFASPAGGRRTPQPSAKSSTGIGAAGACANQTFENFTQATFACLVQKAAASGITINQNEGQISQNGITVRWKFDPVSRTLDIQCLAIPPFLSCGVVNGKIHDLVDSCR